MTRRPADSVSGGPMEQLIQQIFDFLAVAGKEAALFIVSMIPLIELRGSVPLGAALGMPWYTVFLISVVGNMVPVPFAILLGRPVFKWLKSTRLFSGIGGQQGRRGLLIYGSCGLLLALASAVPTVLGALCFGAQKAGISFETVTAAALAVCGIQLMERTIRPGK